MKKHTRLMLLLAGDAITIAILTVIGFATHNETGLGFLPRMATTYFPLVVSWFVAAWGLGLLDPTIPWAHSTPGKAWQALLAALFAGPLAAVLRGLALGINVIPVFAIVLSVTTGLGMLIWRITWAWLSTRRS
jgi:hypothetical protein